VRKLCGSGFLDKYGGSFQRALDDLLPEHSWKPWLFGRVSTRYWSEPNHRKEFVLWLELELKLDSKDEWYSVRMEEFIKRGGSGLLQLYSNSLDRLLIEVFPEHDWKPWLLERSSMISSAFWNSFQNCRCYLEWLANELAIHSMDQWYQVSTSLVRSKGGSGLLLHHGRTLQQALMKLYPEYHDWKVWLFVDILLPEHFWQLKTNCQHFLRWLSNDFQITEYEQWYGIQTKEIYKRPGGKEFLGQYRNSLPSALSTLMPEYDWKPWRFKHTRTLRNTITSMAEGTIGNRDRECFWNLESNRRKYFQWLSRELEIDSPEAWYHVRLCKIRSNGGSGFLEFYRSSTLNPLNNALLELYPDYLWKPWLFSNVPSNYWNDENSLKSYLRWLAEQLQIKQMNDWYNVSTDDIDRLKGTSMRRKFGLFHLLMRLIPNYSWNLHKLAIEKPSSKAQTFLFNMIKQLFPGQSDALFNYRHPNFIFHSSTHRMELDIYLPSIALAIEYHGEHHYAWHYKYGNPKERNECDFEKRLACKQVGITLVEVPFWWDRRKESLLESILSQRPELLRMIPLQYQSQFQKHFSEKNSETNTRNIYQTSLNRGTVSSPYMAVYTRWNPIATNAAFWWVSEKLDGIRAFWDGKKSFLLCNGHAGKKLSTPQWFIKSFPDIPLDGHLWIGASGSFPKQLANVCDWEETNEQWKQVKYRVFDTTHSQLKFEERIDMLYSKVGLNHPIIKLAGLWKSKGNQHLLDELEELSQSSPSLNAIVIKEPKSFYYGNSNFHSSFQKLERFPEGEAIVVGVEESTGKLLCKWPNEKTFSVSHRSKSASSLPTPIGSVITYRSSSSIGLRSTLSPPKYAFLLYHREDLTMSALWSKWIPYQLACGSRSVVVKCRGCHRGIIERSELRIQVFATFAAPHSGPHPGQHNLCLNVKCIEKAIERNRHYPFFDGKVYVSEKIALSQDLPVLEGIQWVFSLRPKSQPDNPNTHF